MDNDKNTCSIPAMVCQKTGHKSPLQMFYSLQGGWYGEYHSALDKPRVNSNCYKITIWLWVNKLVPWLFISPKWLVELLGYERLPVSRMANGLIRQNTSFGVTLSWKVDQVETFQDWMVSAEATHGQLTELLLGMSAHLIKLTNPIQLHCYTSQEPCVSVGPCAWGPCTIAVFK